MLGDRAAFGLKKLGEVGRDIHGVFRVSKSLLELSLGATVRWELLGLGRSLDLRR
jgi:hypothetical protein